MLYDNVQDNGKKSEQEREVDKEGSAEAEDREKKIISSEEEAKARIAEKRREMKVIVTAGNLKINACMTLFLNVKRCQCVPFWGFRLNLLKMKIRFFERKQKTKRFVHKKNLDITTVNALIFFCSLNKILLILFEKNNTI
jgi:hypothetical protein